ncbi:hypothetical protein BG000_001387 [Podila horticola]|nr:hypothetical protein BG000_001387 [Podila horticola]
MSLLQKTASVPVHGVRQYAFVISFILGLGLVVVYLLFFSCNYATTEYKSMICDPAPIQQYQLINLCSSTGECTITTFKSNNLLQYEGKPLSSCVSTTTQFKLLNVYGYSSWSGFRNTITCNDNVNISLDTLSTSGVDKIYHQSWNLTQAVYGDVMAKNATPSNTVDTALINVYFENNMTHYILSTFTAGQYTNYLTTGYTMPNFDAWLAQFIEGMTISTGYICHNCIANEGPFNGGFWVKFLIGLSSLGSTVFTVAAMVFTYKFVVDFRAKIRDEIMGSEHVAVIDKDDPPLY